jgi:hypothetical protein
MNLLGGVAAQGLYKDAAGNDIKGKVHQGFHNMVHDWPTNRLGLPACTEAVAATQVNACGRSDTLIRLLRQSGTGSTGSCCFAVRFVAMERSGVECL